ncbi:hypothetical protein CsatB_022401 [Cannabis sativa]
MAATMATMAILNTKCLTTNKMIMMMNNNNPTKQISSKPNSLFSIQNIPKGLNDKSFNTTIAGTAIAGAIFTTLSACEPAMAVQQIADIAAEATSNDNRGLALLLPIIPAIAWVLFNILQPALNQLNRMRSSKGVAIGLGLGLGAAASGLMGAQEASAGELAAIAEAAAAGSDNRGQLLLLVISPAILWVLYNILQPALNQLNRMRSQ